MTVGRQLRIAEMEADTEPQRLVEQRLGLRSRHLPLEERHDIGVGQVPAGEEGRQRELREHDELGTPTGRFPQHRDDPVDYALARLGARHRAHLRGRDR